MFCISVRVYSGIPYNEIPVEFYGIFSNSAKMELNTEFRKIIIPRVLFFYEIMNTRISVSGVIEEYSIIKVFTLKYYFIA